MDIDSISKQIAGALKYEAGKYTISVNTLQLVKNTIQDYLKFVDPEHDWMVEVSADDGANVNVTCTPPPDDGANVNVTCTPPPEVIARLKI